MPQSSTRQDAGEGGALVTAASPTIELGWSTEFTGDHNQRFIQELSRFQSRINDERRFQILEQFVLLENPVLCTSQPAIEKIEIVRDFQESNSPFDQPTCQQAALSKLATIAVAKFEGSSAS